MQLFNIFKLNLNYKKYRILIIILIILLVYFVYIVRIINLTSSQSKKQHYFKNLNNFRRDIIDRNGKLLATNIPVASIVLRPNKITDKVLAINAIIEIFPEIEKDKIKNYINSNKNFIWLKRGINPEVGKKLHDKGIQGITLEIEHKRLYIY
ncbi:MAG: hypothetical protein U1E31_03335, partial [Rickettsiales bacterium]